MKHLAIGICFGFAACGRKQLPPPPPSDRFEAIAVDTKPGLSGLAVDDHGILYSVSERDRAAFAIDMTQRPPRVTPLPITGPANDPTLAGLDFEGIAWLGGNEFAFALEGANSAFAAVAWATRTGDALHITRIAALPEASLGIELTVNHGAEGICGTGNTVLVALENWQSRKARGPNPRYAPVARIRDGLLEVAYLRLQSKRGKLASLDCTVAPDGSAHVWAIERHYDTTLVESFDMPAVLKPDALDLESHIEVDLTDAVAGQRNIEGIALLPNRKLLLTVDNQGNKANGPSELLLLK
jgi:hypothetical protein